MANVTIELTEAQEKYLKKFYENHKEGSEQNLCTYKPIHVVEQIRYTYVPYSSTIDDYSIKGHVAFICEDHVYHSIESVIEDWNDNVDEEYKVPNYEEVLGKKLNDRIIFDEEDYINASGIENVEVVYAIEHYVPVAFFFIREEAIRYTKYQSHNLTKPRVYTYSPGYSNYGEYGHFFDLLQNMGQILTNKEK